MVRPYKVKGEKRKKKGENYDKEEIEEPLEEESTGSEKRAKTEHTAEDTEAAERVVDLLAGIPVAATDQSTKPGVIFIIERASLEIAKIGKTYQLLNSDEHSNFLKKNGRNPSDYRPDIAHQVGAMAHGKIDKDYVEDYLSISDYPLSAAYCISMITNAVERKWRIL